MRIIGGQFKGKKLVSPTTDATRPTSDRARESLFNILDSLLKKREIPWNQIVFVDAFAGTGAVGIEAASRGAARVFFFEKNPAALKSLRANIAGLDKVTVFEDALAPFKASPAVSMVFMDPPYGKGLWEKALTSFQTQGWIDRGTLVIIEVDKTEKSAIPKGFERVDQRSYGRNTFLFLRLEKPTQENQ